MHRNRFRSIFPQIIAVLWLTLSISGGLSGTALAQTITSVSFNPATAILTAVDSVGNTYTTDIATLSRTAVSQLPATFTAPGGTTQAFTLTVTPTGPGLFSATGDLPTQLALDCAVNTAATTTCTLTPSRSLSTNIANSLAASTKGEIRSQASTVTSLITQRIRGVSREMAESLAPSGAPAAPGDTIILKDFSLNQPSSQNAYGGISAGSPGARWGTWGDASGSFLGDNATNGYSGTSVVAMTGLDYLLDRQWLVGLSAGYIHADLSLTPSTITHRMDGAVVGPYAAYIINSNFAIDALVNYTSLDNTLSAPVPLPAGNFHSNRVTGASDLNFFTNYESLKLTGFGGYTYAWEGGNTAAIVGPGLGNNIRYGAVRLGGEAAYDIGPFEPYIPLTFEYQTTAPGDGTSRAALIIGGGLRYFWADNVTAGLLAETTEIKTHTRDVLVEAHLRVSF
jgi:hypothetical protein